MTFGFCSGHKPVDCGIEPHVGLYTVSAEPAWDSFSPSFSAPSLLMLILFLSLKIIKLKKKRKMLTFDILIQHTIGSYSQSKEPKNKNKKSV